MKAASRIRPGPARTATQIAPSSTPLWICRLESIPYRDALALQSDLAARRAANEIPDVLLLLEHPPTYTRGRRSSPQELPMGQEYYRRQGIEVLDTDRGGRVTYHGPGQLVGYPILRTPDVVRHVRTIEAAIIEALACECISARSRATEGPDFTGVWVEDRKIASIGVHHCREVTTHGFAINVENALEPFSWIVPCGLSGVRMTSVAYERKTERASLPSVRELVAAALCRHLRRRGQAIAPEALVSVDGSPEDARCALHA